MGEATSLQTIDILVLVVFAIGITGLGLYFTRLQKTTKDYFLGGKNLPWWAVMVSIVAAETSAATVIAAPAWSFAPKGGNLTFLQITVGYLLARILIAIIFVPPLRKKEYFSVYNFLEDRFGPAARSIAGVVFFFTRALATGIRVYIPAIVINQMVPALSFDLCVVASVVIALIYTTFGGFRAVVWTDFLMFGIYLFGGLLAIITVMNTVPVGEAMELGARAGKFQLFNLNIWDFTVNYTVLSGFIGGTFLTMATHGTDQALAQRLLACQTKRDSKRAIIGSGIIIIPQFLFFLFLGILLYAFYSKIGFSGLAKDDDVFPHFIINYMPHGVIGILIAGILSATMSTTCSDLNALANISVNDFYRKFIHPNSTERENLLMGKIMTIFWGIVLVFIAYIPRMAPKDWKLLDICLAVPSLFYGSLLGVFLLGFLTRRTNERAAIIGAVIGGITVLGLTLPALFFSWFPESIWSVFENWPKIAWTWWCPIGTVITFVVGSLLGLGSQPPPLKEETPAPQTP